MADRTPTRLLLVVTGSTLRAEEVDRPLAYYLKQKIEARLSEQANAGAVKVLVIADFRWVHDEPLQAAPTISVGGPGVNALAQRWLQEVPISLGVDDRYYLQMDPDLEEPRASVWGMDNPTTQLAVSVFLDRYLDRFLERCLSRPESGLDDDAGDDDQND